MPTMLHRACLIGAHRVRFRFHFYATNWYRSGLQLEPWWVHFAKISSSSSVIYRLSQIANHFTWSWVQCGRSVTGMLCQQCYIGGALSGHIAFVFVFPLQSCRYNHYWYKGLWFWRAVRFMSVAIGKFYTASVRSFFLLWAAQPLRERERDAQPLRERETQPLRERCTAVEKEMHGCWEKEARLLRERCTAVESTHRLHLDTPNQTRLRTHEA